jgi:hypothetical protein
LEYITGPISLFRPFPETFREHLMSALSQQGLASTYQDVRDPRLMSKKEMAALSAREGGNPKGRLLIEVKNAESGRGPRRYLQSVSYVLTLTSTASNQRLWQAQLHISAGAEVPLWNERNATDFANQIVALLKRDGLI